MSSSEVRLWEGPFDSTGPRRGRTFYTSGPLISPLGHGEPGPTHIALPAAEFEAWRRVVGAARKVRSEVIVFEWHQIEPFECDLLQALNAAVDALPNNQQSGPAGAKEGE